MRIIDTHLHLIYPDRLTYPWIAPDNVLNRPWTAEQYFAEATGLGIDAALHMEVDVAQDQIEAETRFVTGLPGIIGAIAACRPEHTDFAAQIERIVEAGQGGVKGFRRVLHVAPDGLSESDVFVENLRALGALGFPFDLCLRGDQLHIASRLARQAPDVTFVLDHCGNPDIKGQGLDPWLAQLSEIAACPNVICKVSGIVSHCAPGWTAETLRPYVEHAITSFGWDRVVWGSDHPVATLTGGTLADWVNATHTIVSGASDDEKAALFHRNAERVWRV